MFVLQTVIKCCIFRPAFGCCTPKIWLKFMFFACKRYLHANAIFSLFCTISHHFEAKAGLTPCEKSLKFVLTCKTHILTSFWVCSTQKLVEIYNKWRYENSSIPSAKEFYLKSIISRTKQHFGLSNRCAIAYIGHSIVCKRSRQKDIVIR